jgi:hypothetical protein
MNVNEPHELDKHSIEVSTHLGNLCSTGDRYATEVP